MKVPSSANVMPTVHRMMYFHAASTASGRLWKPEADEKRGHDGRCLDPDPHDREVVRHGHQQHGKDEQMEQAVIRPHAAEVHQSGLELMLEIADGVDGRGEAQEDHERHDVARKRVHGERAVQRRRSARRATHDDRIGAACAQRNDRPTRLT